MTDFLKAERFSKPMSNKKLTVKQNKYLSITEADGKTYPMEEAPKKKRKINAADMAGKDANAIPDDVGDDVQPFMVIVKEKSGNVFIGKILDTTTADLYCLQVFSSVKQKKHEFRQTKYERQILKSQIKEYFLFPLTYNTNKVPGWVLIFYDQWTAVKKKTS